MSIRRAPRPLCVYYVQGARQARKKVNKRRCRSKPVFVWTPPLVSVAQSCVRHHSQYHHRHPHVQVCHVALFEIVAPASVAGFVVVGVLLFASPSGFVAPSCIIEQASLFLPLSSLVLPFGTRGAPARPRLVWSSVRGKRGSHSNGVWFLLLYAWKPTSNTHSPSLPQHACTAVLPCFCRLPPPSLTTTKRDHATTTTTKQATPSLFCLLAVNVKRCFSSLPFPYTNYSLSRRVA